MGSVPPEGEFALDSRRGKYRMHGVYLISRKSSRGMGTHTYEVFRTGNSGTEHADHGFQIKKWLDERGTKYYSNALAGYVAIGLSIAVGIAYIILVGAVLNAQTAVYLIALILLSWLCAMVGYDKVMQAIAQFKR